MAMSCSGHARTTFSSSPFSRGVFAATQHWTEAHDLFPDRPETLRGYDEAALV